MKVVHETVIKDIVDIFNDVKNSNITDIINTARKRDAKKSMKSIAQLSSNLTLTYPCLVSNSLDITSASMISKAIERKHAQMIQLILGAYQQHKLDANGEFNPIEYLQQFHKNLKISTTGMDVFDTVDSIVGMVKESTRSVVDTSNVIISEAQQIKYLQENTFKDNTLPDMFNESSTVNDYKVDNTYGRVDVYHEDRTAWSNGYPEYNNGLGMPIDPTVEDERIQKLAYNTNKEYREQERHAREAERHYNDTIYSANRERREQERHERETQKFRQDQADRTNKMNMDMAKNAREVRTAQIKNVHTMQQTSQGMIAQLQNVDVKKANELVGTPLMITVHLTNDQGLLDPISFLVAIKSKMYPLESKDIIQRIITKNKDRNFFGKLVKVATGEISFVRDFLFAVDKAKIDSLSQSNKSNSSKLWRVLERMSAKSKFSRTIGKQNEYMAITTLVMSQEEVEYIKRYANMDMGNENVAKGIIDAYNLICLVIVDETNETAKFLFNTDEDLFEELSFNQLEREATDGSYKKMVNLITKMK